MLWSFLKIALFFLLVALVAYGASTVIETGGDVTVAFGGQEIRKSPIEAIVILAAGFIGLLLLFKLAGLLIAFLRFVNGDETAFSRYFDRNRERKGYEALGDSVIALAAGDGKTAIAKANKADKYISRPGITKVVHAQAAQLTGDNAAASRHFKELLKDEHTRFVGVQGLLRQKLDEGDTETALKLAEKAFAINPRHDQTLQTLFSLQSDEKDWSGARRTLQARVRAGTLPKDIGSRREAVISLADAFAEIENGDLAAATDAANKSVRIAPGLIPAAALLGQMRADEGNKRKAARIIKKAWTQNPHPDLAATFAAIEPDEDHAARIKRFQSLLKLRPDHPETKLLEAELFLAAEDFPAARKALGDLAESDPTARSLSIMAAIERGTGADEAVVSGWLAKALGAPRGDAWVCDNCNHIHADWGPSCENCNSFDSLGWKRVPPSDDTKAMEAALLPLLVRPQAESVEDITSVGSAEVVDNAPMEPEITDAPAEETAEKDEENRKEPAAIG